MRMDFSEYWTFLLKNIHKKNKKLMKILRIKDKQNLFKQKVHSLDPITEVVSFLFTKYPILL